MSEHLEDLLASEIEHLNVKISPDAFREILLPIIGRVDPTGFISLEHGSISLRDYVRSVRQANPELFLDASDPESETTGNLTEQMRQEVAESRSRALPSDWTTVRNRCAGLTAQYMDEIAGERQN